MAGRLSDRVRHRTGPAGRPNSASLARSPRSQLCWPGLPAAGSGAAGLPGVVETMWSRVNLLSPRRQAGLRRADRIKPATDTILPSEARSLAAVTRCRRGRSARRPARRRSADGFGRNGHRAGLGQQRRDRRCASRRWPPRGRHRQTRCTATDHPVRHAKPAGTLDREHPLFQASTTAPRVRRSRAGWRRAIVALAATDYVPVQPGAQAQPDQHGFVLTRTLYASAAAAGQLCSRR